MEGATGDTERMNQAPSKKLSPRDGRKRKVNLKAHAWLKVKPSGKFRKGETPLYLI